MFRFCLLVASLSLLAGCARMDVRTDIRPDGSFQRQVVYTVNEPDQKEGGMSMSPKPEEVFDLPKAGPGLTVTKVKKNDDTLITVTRVVATGQKAVKDAVVLANKKPELENEASVTSNGDGTWVYSEKLRWAGEKMPDYQKDNDFRPMIKKVLPPDADTATIDRVTRKATAAIWRVLFGPSDPMISLLVMHPSLAERKFRERAALALDATFADEGLSPEARKKLQEAISSESSLEQIFSPQKEAKKQQEKEEPSTGGGFVPLMFVVKVPGTVVETNGQTDAVTGEVYWALYPESTAVGDVELKVVYRP